MQDEITVCGGQVSPRTRIEFSEVTSHVELSIIPSEDNHFLVKFEGEYEVYGKPTCRKKYDVCDYFDAVISAVTVLGCETPPAVPLYDLEIVSEDLIVYTCQTTGEQWRLTCLRNEWQGNIGNCSEGALLKPHNSVVCKHCDTVFCTVAGAHGRLMSNEGLI